MSSKIFIITGEPSGDLHGSNLVQALKRQNPDVEISCWGGDRMAAQGAKVLKHIDELSFMGFVEVAANITTILKNFKLCEEHIRSFKPDLVVLMDFPGFNLRMAKKIKQMGIPVAYYISPQIWAWKESRVEKIKRFVDHVYVILPFEEKFYRDRGVDAEFVGHPLLDEIGHIHVDSSEFRNEHGLDERPIIALLPGSRKQEIKLLLQPMTEVIEAFPQYQFIVSKVAWQEEALYANLPENAVILEGNTHALLSVAEAAIVTSGTATLETALIGTPEVVVYKANSVSVAIARRLVKVDYISLVNLIMDREVVKELIQDEVNAKQMIAELSSIIEGGSRRENILSSYAELKERLGKKGASEIVASRLLKIIS